MHEVTARKIVELFRGGLPTQHLVPVRVTTKSSDHLAVPTGLAGGELEPGPKLRRRLPNELLGKPDCEVEVLQLLRVGERENEEGLLPWRLQQGVVAGLETAEREGQCLLIVRERPTACAMDRTRELVQHD